MIKLLHQGELAMPTHTDPTLYFAPYPFSDYFSDYSIIGFKTLNINPALSRKREAGQAILQINACACYYSDEKAAIPFLYIHYQYSIIPIQFLGLSI